MCPKPSPCHPTLTLASTRMFGVSGFMYEFFRLSSQLGWILAEVVRGRPRFGGWWGGGSEVILGIRLSCREQREQAGLRTDPCLLVCWLRCRFWPSQHLWHFKIGCQHLKVNRYHIRVWISASLEKPALLILGLPSREAGGWGSGRRFRRSSSVAASVSPAADAEPTQLTHSPFVASAWSSQAFEFATSDLENFPVYLQLWLEGKISPLERRYARNVYWILMLLGNMKHTLCSHVPVPIL